MARQALENLNDTLPSAFGYIYVHIYNDTDV